MLAVFDCEPPLIVNARNNEKNEAMVCSQINTVAKMIWRKCLMCSEIDPLLSQKLKQTLTFWSQLNDDWLIDLMITADWLFVYSRLIVPQSHYCFVIEFFYGSLHLQHGRWTEIQKYIIPQNFVTLSCITTHFNLHLMHRF